MLTNADVRPECKGKMPVLRLAEYIEPIGRVEFGRITIRRTGRHVQKGPSRNFDTAELRIAIRHARLNQYRPLPPQCFLDGQRHECSVLANRLQLIWIIQQSGEQYAR